MPTAASVTVATLKEVAASLGLENFARDNKALLVRRIIEHLQALEKPVPKPKAETPATKSTVIYSAQFEPDEDEDGNELDIDHVVQRDIGRILTQQPRLKKVSAIVFTTGYTDRLYGAGGEKRLAFLKPSVVYPPKNLMNTTAPYVADKKAKAMVDAIGQFSYAGAVVFPNKMAIDVLELYSKLQQARYCSMHGIVTATWFDVDGKAVLWVGVDTESG